MKKTKYIKIKKPKTAVCILQNWIIDKKTSNAVYISLPLHFLCRKFIKDLQDIPLSEELQ